MSSISYRPEIDGLRAVAVIPVILFHLGFGWIPGGYAGVDVFFVISGFLITSIIIKEQEQGTFSFVSFWLRRIKRILPVLLACVFVTLSTIFLFGYRNELLTVGRHALAAILSAANIVIWRTSGDYWGPRAENSPFLHCWSLSVEEQFYLFYPAILLLLLKKKKEWAVPVIVAILSGSLVLFLYCSKHYPVEAFYLLPARSWELAAGCLVALLRTRWNCLSIKIRALLQTVGLILIIASYFIMKGDVGPLMIVPVLGSALFIACGSHPAAASRLLGGPAFVWIGKISYSLYIWHWPVIVLSRQFFFRQSEQDPFRILVSVLVTIFLSLISYQFIERPFRRPGKKLIPIGIAFAACASIAAAFVIFNPSKYYDTSDYAPVVLNVSPYNVGFTKEYFEKTREKSQTVTKQREGVVVAEPDLRWQEAYANEGILKKYGRDKPDIMVLGDSHATMWSAVIDSISSELSLTTSFFGAAGVSPFVEIPLPESEEAVGKFSGEQKLAFDRAKLKCIREWKPLVILSVRWNHYCEEDVKGLMEYLQSCGCRILLVEQPPEVSIGDRNSAQYLAYLKIKPVTGGRRYLPTAEYEEVLEGRRLIKALSEKYPCCAVVRLYDIYSNDADEAMVLDGKEIMYYDDDHLSEAGARKAKDRLKTAIQAALVPDE